MKNLKANPSVIVKLKALIFLLIALGLASGLIYLVNQKTSQVQKQAQNTQKSKSAQEEKKVLDCAKKLQQDPDTLSQKEISDCLFIGCGNFFQ